MHNNKPIGVFDSGIGGLTVLKELKKLLLTESFVYFGDTARVPYGPKSKETIIKYSKQIVDFLLKKNVKLIVVACNSASSVALDALTKAYSIPIIGVIKPASFWASSITLKKRVGIIGTYATINSKSYEQAIKSYNNKIKVFSKPCPLFVPIVEEGIWDGEITYLIAKNYLEFFNEKKVDTLVLGCTHYPILKNTISKILPNVKLVDPGETVAETVRNILKNKNVESNSKGQKIEYFVSDISFSFLKFARNIIDKKIKIKKIQLE